MAYSKHNFINGQIVTATDLNEMDSGIIGARAKSLFDNGNWLNPVNCRGASSYTGNGIYTIDRWILSCANGDAKVTVGTGVTVTIGTSATSMVQRFEKNILSTSKTYTWAYQTTSGAVTVGTATVSSSTSYDSVSVPFTASKTIAWIALYEGSYTSTTVPAYVPKSYTEEALICKRYCRSFDYGAGRHVTIPGAATSGTTAIYASLPIDVPMRATPSLSSTAGGNWRYYGGGASNNPTSVGVWYAGQNAIGLNFIVASVTAGQTYVVTPATSTVVVLSADL